MNLNNLYCYITWNCNLHCSHCWVEGGVPESSSLSFEEWKNIFQEAKDAGIHFLKITGGEPLLKRELTCYLIEASARAGIEVLLETNGTLLTDQDARFLKKNHCTVSISLDGDEEAHDRQRNVPGAYKAAMNGIRLCLSNGLVPQIVYSFSSPDSGDIAELIHVLAPLKIKYLKLNPILSVGRGKQDIQEHSVFSLSASELLRIYRKWCIVPGDLTVQMMVPCSYLGYSILWQKNTSCIVCPYDSTLSVLPDGIMGLCGAARRTEAFRYGNIRDYFAQKSSRGMSLASYLEDSPRYQDICHFPAGSQTLCSRCVFLSKCKGSCRAAAYWSFHDLNAPNPLCVEMQKSGRFPFVKSHPQ